MIDARAAMYCLEVGQGASTAILEPRPGIPNEYQATIIDVGRRGTRLAAWLQSLRVTYIPAVILTHNHSDHIGSLIQLVNAFKGSIDKVRFVVDGQSPPSTLLPPDQWREDGWVHDVDILSAPSISKAAPRPGRLIVGQEDGCSFRLYCVYPLSTFMLVLLKWLPSPLSFFLPGGNRLSAVLVLTPVNAATPNHAVFGGDLNYKGWEYLAGIVPNLTCEVLLVPHHGGPQDQTKSFGSNELAQTTRPNVALVSVGTDNTYSLPHEDLIRAMRSVGATVLCTQITQQCLPPASPPHAVAAQAVRQRLANTPRLCPTGTACAGTIVVTFPANGPDVQRLNDHRTEVNNLQNLGHQPLCR